MSTPPVATHFFDAPDGVRLAWHEMGDAAARPTLLLHGLFSNAFTNWIRYGHAEKVAATGRRVIMPDLRAHGASGAPHEAALYPPDVLASDGLALIAHLGLTGYDLGGYSLEGLLGLKGRADHFRGILTNLGKHQRGTPEWMAEAFLKTTKADPQALLPLLDSFVNVTDEELDTLTEPTLVVCGAEDGDNGSAPHLAARLTDARYAEVPGGHMSAVVQPELGAAMADFLAG